MCAVCGLAFGLEPPHADHIIPVQSKDDPLFFEPSNIQFLHSHCHGLKTASDVANGLTR
jgi:5-methylcytosine-specific restriction endonuclease McrA